MSDAAYIIDPQAVISNINPLTKLGSYWRTKFGDPSFLLDFTNSRSYLEVQQLQSLSETEKMLSRTDFPLFRYYFYKKITIEKTDIEFVSYDILKYKSYQGVFGQVSPWLIISTIPQFGKMLTISGWYKLKLPIKLVNAQCIVNALKDPTFFISSNEFLIDQFSGELYIQKNPFDFKSNIFQDKLDLFILGALVDEGEFDSAYGRLFNFRANVTTVAYKNATNALIDSYIFGTTVKVLKDFLCSYYNIPVAKSDETIQDIASLGKTVIITDKNTYNINPTAIITVAKNDTVLKDTVLTDELTILEPVDLVKTITIPLVKTTKSVIPLSKTIMDNLGVSRLTRQESGTSLHEISGLFRNKTIAIPLSNLPKHQVLSIEFDLYLFGYWAGVDGTELFQITIDNKTLLNTQFSTIPTVSSVIGHAQWFPYNVGIQQVPALTGVDICDSDKSVVSWFKFPAYGFLNPITQQQALYPKSCKYKIQISCPHTSDTADINISMTGVNSDLWCVATFVDVIRKIRAAYYTSSAVYSLLGAEPELLFSDSYNPNNKTNRYVYPATFWAINRRSLKVTVLTTEQLAYPPVNSGIQSDPLDSIQYLQLEFYDFRDKKKRFITVDNKETELKFLGYDSRGFTRCRFNLNGFEEDINRFWEIVEDNTVKYGISLASYLDTRPKPYNQPDERFLPKTINPLKFFVKNILGGSFLFIKLGLNAANSTYLPSISSNTIADQLYPNVKLIIMADYSVPISVQNLYSTTNVASFITTNIPFDIDPIVVYTNVDSSYY